MPTKQHKLSPNFAHKNNKNYLLINQVKKYKKISKKNINQKK